ncbi:hypothetical protein [Aquidulcibacter sp.]|jgi:hypothetical protein|uniref:hypothetical protein n=1 Tax=Aquidulcibacter sp. TaxID=2052990 RepID=UPI003BA7D294
MRSFFPDQPQGRPRPAKRFHGPNLAWVAPDHQRDARSMDTDERGNIRITPAIKTGKVLDIEPVKYPRWMQ